MDSIRRKIDLATFLPQLQKEAEKLGDYAIIESVSTLLDTYKSMLRFTVMGAYDPDTPRILAQLREDALRIYSDTLRLKRIRQSDKDRYVVQLHALRGDNTLCEKIFPLYNQLSSDFQKALGDRYEPYMENTMLLSGKDTTPELALLRSRHEELRVRMFTSVWTSAAWSLSEYRQAQQMIKGDVLPRHDKSIFISAVTLSLMEQFDSHKFMLLLDAFAEGERGQDSKEELKTKKSELIYTVRALVGIIITLRQYPNIHENYPQITSRLALLLDDDHIRNQFFTTLLQLQVTSMTEHYSNRMRNDILPSIIKGAHKAAKSSHTEKEKKDAEENLDNLFGTIEDEDAQEKMREMMELYTEGVDIYMETFGHVKGFPFFNAIPHWFYPFSFNDQSLADIMKDIDLDAQKETCALFSGAPFCDNDRYSFIFLLGATGKDSFSMLTRMIDESASEEHTREELEQRLSDRSSENLSANAIRRSYIFGLYRFYKCYAFRTEFTNPFDKTDEQPYTPSAIPALMALTEDTDGMIRLGDFLMRHEQYTNALTIFDNIRLNSIDDSKLTQLWQKKGFCQQRLGYFEDARTSYMNASALKPDSKWTLQHLARVCKQTFDYTQALQCYEELGRMEPDKVRYISEQAKAHILCGDTEKALPLLHKANYLQPGNPDTMRNIILCQLAQRPSGEDILKIETTALGLVTQTSANEDIILQSLVSLYAGKFHEAYDTLLSLADLSAYDSVLQPYLDFGIIDTQKAQLLRDAVTFKAL